ncbi:MAG: dUTP diphosphatase [Chlamydiota bacterium]
MLQKEIEIPTTSDSNEQIPHYGSEGAAGADVRADIDSDLAIPAGESVLVPTGLRFEIPEGYEIQVRPRSGLAFKHQVTVLNTPGTIDHDYRGELKVILINHGKETFNITPGMRIAQLIVAPVTRARFVRCAELATTERGHGGFGSTGTH